MEFADHRPYQFGDDIRYLDSHVYSRLHQHHVKLFSLHQSIEVAELLSDFSESETGQAVAAANKRIANILKKAGDVTGEVNASLFAEAAEKDLFVALEAAETSMPEHPEGMLETLAGLREPVDRFFDDVMVMADDAALQNNRLALLARLRALFLRLADISRL